MEDKERRNNRQNNFIRNTYDRMTVTFPKGKKDEYRELADKAGMSLNALINKLLEDMKKPL